MEAFNILLLTRIFNAFSYWIISRLEGVSYSGITVYIANLKKCAIPFLFVGSMAAQFEVIKFYQGRRNILEPSSISCGEVSSPASYNIFVK